MVEFIDHWLMPFWFGVMAGYLVSSKATRDRVVGGIGLVIWMAKAIALLAG